MVLLRKDHAADPRMKHVVRLCVRRTDETADLLRDVMAKSPDNKTAAAACRLLLDYVGDEAKAGEEMNDKPFLKPLFELRTNADYYKRVLNDLAKNQKETKELTELLADKYKGVLPDLSVGQPLPEVAFEDLEGKKVKPADLNGKVVVLYILSTQDSQAAKLIEHQRDLAKKNQGKPMAVVNVFVADKKDAPAEFVKKNPTPGTDCWSGPKDNVLEAWNLPKTPATFILDAKGVIRFRDRYRGALDEAVGELLKDLDKK
jgi:peroxiredoxin